MPTVIHVSPHPDDESIAAPCTLLTLKDAGWDVVNFAAGLGRPDDRERRRRELKAALGHARFELVESGALPGISRGDDLGAACRTLTGELTDLVRARGARLIVGPHPREGHHGHLTVARAVRQTVWAARGALTWWMWSMWADLPRPTMVVDCTPGHLTTSLDMLEEHTGEVARSDYRRMHEAIRTVNAVRGVEKTFGYGSVPKERLRGIQQAELLTELTVRGRKWRVGAPRLLDPRDPLRTRWEDLDDSSILSSTRLRPLYRPWLLDLHARWGRWRRTPGAPPDPVDEGLC